jgi:hypothetical protein
VLLCSRDASGLASITSRDPPDRGLGPVPVTYEHVSSRQQRAALLAARVSVSQLSRATPTPGRRQVAPVCHTANQLRVAPYDCCSELQSTTEAVRDAWPPVVEKTSYRVLAPQCACRTGLGAAQIRAKRPRSSIGCLERAGCSSDQPRSVAKVTVIDTQQASCAILRTVRSWLQSPHVPSFSRTAPVLTVDCRRSGR